MKIKDIIKYTAILLSKEDVVSYLESTNPQNTPETTLQAVDTMVRLSNLVIGELASTYIPVKKSESVSISDGKLLFSTLSFSPVKILSAQDDMGSELSFKVFPEYLLTENSCTRLVYTFIPSNYGLTDTLDYTEKDVTMNILSFGLAAEYCLTEGRFDEAVMWRNRYSDDLVKFIKPKNFSVKGRSFI